MRQGVWNWRKSRIILPLVILAGFFLFPNAIPSDVTFVHQLPEASCATHLVVDLFQRAERGGADEGEEKLDRVRGYKQRLQSASAREVTHTMKLPDGEYVARIVLNCDEEASKPVFQPIVVNGSGQIPFDLSDRCPCEGAKANASPGK